MKWEHVWGVGFKQYRAKKKGVEKEQVNNSVQSKSSKNKTCNRPLGNGPSMKEPRKQPQLIPCREPGKLECP